MKVSIWCPECMEFHIAKQDKNYPNIWTDKCNHIVSIRIDKV